MRALWELSGSSLGALWEFVAVVGMIVYGDSFQWTKYGHLILPSNLDLKSNNKAGLRQTFWKCLIDFLCTGLDGNLFSNLNLLSTSKLDHYLSKKLEGLSETANKGDFFGSTYVE